MRLFPYDAVSENTANEYYPVGGPVAFAPGYVWSHYKDPDKAYVEIHVVEVPANDI